MEKQCKTTLNFPLAHCQTQTTHPQQKWESQYPQTIISKHEKHHSDSWLTIITPKEKKQMRVYGT